MRKFFHLLSISLVTACSQGIEVPEPPDYSTLVAAQKDAIRYVGPETKVLAVCGASTGGGVYLDNLDEAFDEDGISSGQIIFVEDADGNPNILSRDALPELIVASEDGGVVNRISGREPSGLGLWTIVYPQTGVTVSHNLSGLIDGQLVDLWVQNKPPLHMLPARAQTFLAACTEPR